MSLLEERSQSERAPVRVDPPVILDLDRDPLLADRQDEVDLRLGGPLGEVRYVEVRDSAKVCSDCALRDVTGEIGEVRAPLEAFEVEGHGLLEPALTQTVVDDTELRRASGLLEPQFERPHEPHEQGTLEEPQVTQDSLPSDVGLQHSLELDDQRGLRRRLTGIAAAEPKHLFKELR